MGLGSSVQRPENGTPVHAGSFLPRNKRNICFGVVSLLRGLWGGWFTLVPYLAPQHDGWAGSVAVLREWGSTKIKQFGHCFRRSEGLAEIRIIIFAPRALFAAADPVYTAWY